MGCEHGEILELDVHENDLNHDSNETFRLNDIKVKQLKFKSVKSQIRRDKKLTAIKERKAGKRLMKSQKLKELKRQNPDIRIDENAFLGKFIPLFGYFQIGKCLSIFM